MQLRVAIINSTNETTEVMELITIDMFSNEVCPSSVRSLAYLAYSKCFTCPPRSPVCAASVRAAKPLLLQGAHRHAILVRPTKFVQIVTVLNWEGWEGNVPPEIVMIGRLWKKIERFILFHRRTVNLGCWRCYPDCLSKRILRKA